MGLDFSRDGEWVAYNDASDGTMWRSKVDGTQKLQLVFPPMLAYLPRWSPDGKQIVFFGHPPGEPWQIYTIPAQGGAPELIYRSATNSADPTWSPDGKSLAFGENSLNNQGSAVYVMDLKTRKPVKLPGSDGLVFSALVSRRTLHWLPFRWIPSSSCFLISPRRNGPRSPISSSRIQPGLETAVICILTEFSKTKKATSACKSATENSSAFSA